MWWDQYYTSWGYKVQGRRHLHFTHSNQLWVQISVHPCYSFFFLLFLKHTVTLLVTCDCIKVLVIIYPRKTGNGSKFQCPSASHLPWLFIPPAKLGTYLELVLLVLFSHAAGSQTAAKICMFSWDVSRKPCRDQCWRRTNLVSNVCTLA